jgi:hypothetical protein
MLEKANDQAVLAVTQQENFDITSVESKEALAVALYDKPQVECPVYHRFGPGIYIREAHYPAGTLVVGQEHYHAHMCILLKGRILVSDGGVAKELVAPFIFVAQPGSKVGYILEDVVWQNIYATTETDVEVLEKTLFKGFDSWEELKQRRLDSAKEDHEEDRQDYLKVLEESGWTEEDVQKAVNYSGDKIPFPDGTYMVCPSGSPIQGKGLFATAPFLKGMSIAPMRLNGKRTPAGYLVNHSKNPNCTVVFNTNEDIYLIADKQIEGMRGGVLGDELTIDYRYIMKMNNLWMGD